VIVNACQSTLDAGGEKPSSQVWRTDDEVWSISYDLPATRTYELDGSQCTESSLTVTYTDGTEILDSSVPFAFDETTGMLSFQSPDEYYEGVWNFVVLSLTVTVISADVIFIDEPLAIVEVLEEETLVDT